MLRSGNYVYQWQWRYNHRHALVNKMVSQSSQSTFANENVCTCKVTTGKKRARVPLRAAVTLFYGFQGSSGYMFSRFFTFVCQEAWPRFLVRPVELHPRHCRGVYHKTMPLHRTLQNAFLCDDLLGSRAGTWSSAFHNLSWSPHKTPSCSSRIHHPNSGGSKTSGFKNGLKKHLKTMGRMSPSPASSIASSSARSLLKIQGQRKKIMGTWSPIGKDIPLL